MRTLAQIKARVKALETEREEWIREAKRQETPSGYDSYARSIVRSINDQLKLLAWVTGEKQ